ncbi:MAG: hypothetical protein ABIA59_05680, partial [Candidatus Latescibacterota bacterium]
MTHKICICLVALMLPFCPAGLHAGVSGTDPAAQNSQDPHALFAQGNSLYEQGDFESAGEVYASLIERNVVDKDLYYNLANAYF